ncbi:MAG: glycine zipper domain-containing protein [bacterium]
MIDRVFIVGLIGAAMLFSGCETVQNNPNTAADAGIGALLGAGAGMIAGNNIKGINRGEGAIAGALLGGVLGGAIGHQSDKTDRNNAQMNAQLLAVQEQATTTIINVNNSNGSTTPVTIRRAGNQYIGPRGEYYNALPTVGQLRPVYGF